MAVRYTQKKKDDVVAFVQKHNKANNRGGQTAAAEKFGISPITVSKWLQNAGVKKSTAKKATKRSSAGGRKVSKAASSITDVLGRMTAIQKEIGSLQAEYESLKAKL